MNLPTMDLFDNQLSLVAASHYSLVALVMSVKKGTISPGNFRNIHAGVDEGVT